jgi:sugar phosphate permease
VSVTSSATERLGARVLITGGLVVMALGLAILAFLPTSAPIWSVSAGMLVVGLSGPLVMPPMMGALLNSVPEHRAGTASGVFNTSRQIGGALAIVVFGALLANQSTFLEGQRTSLLIAAAVALAAAAGSLLLPRSRCHRFAALSLQQQRLPVGGVPAQTGCPDPAAAIFGYLSP